MSLGPNDTLPCPSPARLVSHRAHGVACLVCDPDAEWTARCPLCLDSVPAVGRVVQPHRLGRWAMCPGEGSEVEPPAPVERPVWAPGMPRLGVVRTRGVA